MYEFTVPTFPFAHAYIIRNRMLVTMHVDNICLSEILTEIAYQCSCLRIF
jgi:hypothetical protein